MTPVRFPGESLVSGPRWGSGRGSASAPQEIPIKHATERLGFPSRTPRWSADCPIPTPHPIVSMRSEDALILVPFGSHPVSQSPSAQNPGRLANRRFGSGGTGCDPVLRQPAPRKTGYHPVSQSPSARNPYSPTLTRIPLLQHPYSHPLTPLSAVAPANPTDGNSRNALQALPHENNLTTLKGWEQSQHFRHERNGMVQIGGASFKHNDRKTELRSVLLKAQVPVACYEYETA